MKKVDILDMLAGEYLEKKKKEEENFNSRVSDFERVKKECIIPYIENNQELYAFGFKFDLNSNDELIKKKSEYILKDICAGFKSVVANSPETFDNYVNDEGYDSACMTICHICTFSCITQLKNSLKNIK